MPSIVKYNKDQEIKKIIKKKMIFSWRYNKGPTKFDTLILVLNTVQVIN